MSQNSDDRRIERNKQRLKQPGNHRTERDQQQRRSGWKRRPGLSRAVGVARWLSPLVLAAATAVVVAVAIPEPNGTLGLVSWWAGLLAAAAVVLVVSWRVARRAIPLSILLGMGIVFPGEAPNRLAVAARAANARDPQRGLAMAESIKGTRDPSVAAQLTVALAAAAGANDPSVRGHAQRVAQLAYLVGYELHLDEGSRERLRWGALLHDIGKVIVHPGIVKKRSSLTSGERTLLRAHPVEGEKLAAPLAGWLGEWGSAISEHHERYDGDGYPEGLAGEEISLGGRIVAVVDAYDTMTNVRANRRALSPDAARAELARCAGGQFDPEVIRAFLAIPKRRLRRRPVPVALLNTIPIGGDGPELAAVGRIAAALVVLGSAVGFLGWKAWTSDERGSGAGSASAGGAPANGAQSPDPEFAPGNPLDNSNAVATRAASGGTTSTDPRGDDHPRSAVARSGHDRGSHTGSQRSTRSDPPTKSSNPTSTSAPSPSPTSPPGPTPTTSHPSPPPTTSHPSPPPTTSKTKPPPPPTTSPPSPPPPAPPTGLEATASCHDVIVGPEIRVDWTDSTSSVRDYEVLRSSNGSNYSPVGFVGPTSGSYTDTSVQGLGITYWYEIEARSSSGSSIGGPVSATTPLLCLSGGAAPRREARSDVEHRERTGEDSGQGEVGLGIDLDDVYGLDRGV
jgi:hypothetical protein